MNPIVIAALVFAAGFAALLLTLMFRERKKPNE